MRVCKHCNSPNLYESRGKSRGLLCHECFNRVDRERRAERRKDPEYRRAALEKERARSRARYAEDPEYRARKLKATQKRRLFYQRGDLTEVQWEALISLYGGLCAYCCQPAEVIDHIVPMNHGGTHSVDNVVPACSPCNLAKGDTPLIIWGGQG
ncbi:HNH endonuclease [Streptomyces sp. NBC_00237]|uniref:HNH endonuclease n=1 Tax=Streptomyces sp. NBC_00237 TaxID=2975687 RepID=UPI00338E4AA1